MDRRLKSVEIRYPGFTPQASEIRALSRELYRKLNVLDYKQSRSEAWIVFVGGTGTGKSTLFNAFCGLKLSRTGMERPKTIGPIAYAFHDLKIEENFPFNSIKIERQPLKIERQPLKIERQPLKIKRAIKIKRQLFKDKKSSDLNTSSNSLELKGKPGYLTIQEHDNQEWSPYLIADTPDLDSVDLKNHEMAEDLYLLSDLVVFVTSQEKYADEVPYRFLEKIIIEKKPYFFLLNKATASTTTAEIKKTFEQKSLTINDDRISLIPVFSSSTEKSIENDPSFQDFKDKVLSLLSEKGLHKFHQAETERRADELILSIDLLFSYLKNEEAESRKWQTRLDKLYQEACSNLLEEQKKRFTDESKEYLQQEIRKLFERYDLLSRPRKIIQGIITQPLRLLGLGKLFRVDSPDEAIKKVQAKIDLSSVSTALERFNRLVLETMSGLETDSPLATSLMGPGVVLSDREIKERVKEEQEALASWLEETFKELSRDIPKTKEWGIYSVSVFWGIMLLSLEASIGGGFTVLDAVLGTTIAPFISKGTVEMFAYNEIRKIANDLGQRYRDGFLAVVSLQRDRYLHCLKENIMSAEEIDNLRMVKDDLKGLGV